jgi:hypothetical protein
MKSWVRAVGGLSGGVEGDMLRRNGSESSELLAAGLGRRSAGTAKAPHITRHAGKLGRVGE